MADLDVTPTQSAFLALKDERQGMQEGYHFLDEKRFILAAACLTELARYEAALTAFNLDYQAAVSALREAVARHGVEGLGLYPAAAPIDGALQLQPRPVLGVTLYDLNCALDPPEPPAETPLASPEAGHCRALFRDLVPRAAALAAAAANLERLRADYARTARRARALEDVLLPEIDDTLRRLEGALEDLEREESVRARRIGQ
jgi:V/A-type H+/Na+-transporting ATPase subunit D